MEPLKHSYKFDPAYGYSLEELLAVSTAEGPEDFDVFWEARYAEALTVDPRPLLSNEGPAKHGWREFDLNYGSTAGVEIGGWCLVPESGEVEKVFVVLHGYGGREGPDYHLPFENSAILFPCARGISRSTYAPISSEPVWHVLHNIQDPHKYVHGGCVEDVWLGVSAALHLFPEVAGRVGLLGISFGGGIGAMALAFDPRIGRAHFNVPSFGNNPLRLTLPTTGSGASVQIMNRRKPGVVDQALAYHDAAVSAKRIQQPVHFACARFDPMVAPPGQFAVYNEVRGEKELFILRAGHYDYPEQEAENVALLREINEFFQRL
ncbi:MAG: acetylxylan esterase [Verrucomicrobiota bacterium]